MHLNLAIRESVRGLMLSFARGKRGSNSVLGLFEHSTRVPMVPTIWLGLSYDSEMRKTLPWLETLVLILALGSAMHAAGPKKVITPKDFPAGRPYSAGILVGDTLYVAGQVGSAKGTIPENFEDEVKQCLKNVEAILEAGGMGFADVVSSTVYLTDMTLFERMNAVYTGIFKEPRPVRTTVGVAKLVGTARIEITVIAHK
jgi:2-iminobutanoate/2-iminopropanoate deaminase